jgi:hypothetical protein
MKSKMGVHAGRSVLEEAKRFSNEGKVVGEYVKNTTNYNWTLIVACIIIGAGYLILKFIKNKTDILKD